MFCMNCGKSLPEGAKFCMYCGTQAGKTRAESAAAPAPQTDPEEGIDSARRGFMAYLPGKGLFVSVSQRIFQVGEKAEEVRERASLDEDCYNMMVWKGKIYFTNNKPEPGRLCYSVFDPDTGEVKELQNEERGWDFRSNGWNVIYRSGRWAYHVHEGEDACLTRMDVETGEVEHFPLPDGFENARMSLAGGYGYVSSGETCLQFSLGCGPITFTRVTDMRYMVPDRDMDFFDEVAPGQLLFRTFFDRVQLVDVNAKKLLWEEEADLSDFSGWWKCGGWYALDGKHILVPEYPIIRWKNCKMDLKAEDYLTLPNGDVYVWSYSGLYRFPKYFLKGFIPGDVGSYCVLFYFNQM